MTEQLPDARSVLIAEQEKEIERLRLTDAEREAVGECIKCAFPASHPTADTLRGLLQRLG
jgi:hypothetical protein